MKTRVEQTITKLEEHFDCVTLGPPVSEARIAHAEARYWGRAMEGLSEFYRCCDGLDVGLRDSEDGQILTLKASTRIQSIVFDSGRPPLWPVRSDGCGNHDCVVLGEGVGAGAVVFYDHDYEIADGLLGSSFETYFELLAGSLIKVYLPNGEIDSRYECPSLDAYPWVGTPEMEHPWPHDLSWMAEIDPGAAAIFQHPDVAQLLRPSACHAFTESQKASMQDRMMNYWRARRGLKGS